MNRLYNHRKRNTALSISWGHVDPAVAIAEDGYVLAYVEEERLSRFKHAYGKFPAKALVECLAIARLEIDEVKFISVNWDIPRYENGEMQYFYELLNSNVNPGKNTLDWQRANLKRYTRSNIQNELRRQFKLIFGDLRLPEIVSFGHHFVHAWQAAVMSGFHKTSVLVLDGSGDDLATSLWQWQKGVLVQEAVVRIPSSLGWFYSAITEFLGFSAYDGEHKVMAMSAYGQEDTYLDNLMAEILPTTENGYGLDTKFIHNGQHTYSARFTDTLAEVTAIPPKLGSASYMQTHFDIARAAQKQLEKATLSFLAKKGNLSSDTSLCLSGGVALNVTLGACVQKVTNVKKIFVNPLSSDAGAVVGAAMLATAIEPHCDQLLLRSLSLGRSFPDAVVLAEIRERGLRVGSLPGCIANIVEMLISGGLVAWYQGGAEAGPRALGFRSILCDPRNLMALNRLTLKVKHREWWQPYGVSMLEAYVNRYLSRELCSENMSIAVPVTSELRNLAPSVVHRDGTVRPHVARPELHRELCRVLAEFGRRTGLYLLVNTSLNRKGEPMAYSPVDALTIFEESELDAIVMGGFFISKQEQ